MWLIAHYEPVTLFSLKLSSATASGGKSLLVPTPFAIKMALLDAACRTLGLEQAQEHWPIIRDLRVGLEPAAQAVVTNLFQKVLKPRRNAVSLDETDAGYFQRTISYREYVQFIGAIGVALGWDSNDENGWLNDLLLNINYFGKRGGFMQLLPPAQFTEKLPPAFVEATSDSSGFNINGTLQVLDDCTNKLTFSKADIYSEDKIKMGKDRITRNIVLPNYKLKRSSKSFSLFGRIE